jgi:hypothetical protein
VHVVTFTLLKDQVMHLFQHSYTHIKTPERLLKCSIKVSYINKTQHVSVPIPGPDSSRPDSTQAGTLDTNTNKGHKTTYQYKHMTKRAAEACWH